MIGCGGEDSECPDGQVPEQDICVDAPPTKADCHFPNHWSDGACAFRLDWSGEDLSGGTYQGLSLGGLILSGTNLSDADLSDADLGGADLSDALLVNADLDGALLGDADLAGATLSGATWDGAICPDEKGAIDRGAGATCIGHFPYALLEGWSLSGWSLVGANLANARAAGANLATADLTGANLAGMDLTGASLAGTTLIAANFDGAVFTDATCPDNSVARVRLDGQAATCVGTFKGAYLPGADLTGWDLADAHLVDADLTGAILDEVVLDRADLDGANLLEAWIRRAHLTGAILGTANLASATLTDSDLSSIDGTDVTWTDTTLIGVNFTDATLGGVDWGGVDLTGALLSGTNFQDASLVGAYLSESSLLGVDFTNADLQGASLTGAAVDLNIVWSNTVCPDGSLSSLHSDFWTALADGNGETCLATFPFVADGMDLSGADLTGADLSGLSLVGSSLTDATLVDTDLSGTSLADADLTSANLTQADLTGTNLSNADLTAATLTDAILTDADLTGANLSSADLTGAELSGADLSGADLSSAVLDGNTWCGTQDDWGWADATTVCPSEAFAVVRFHDGYDDRYSCVGDVGVINANLAGCDLQAWDLQGASLIGMNWDDADLTNAVLDGADWCADTGGPPPSASTATQCPSGVVYYRLGNERTCVGDNVNNDNADLKNCDLTDYVMEGAYLVGADLTDATLDGVGWCHDAIATAGPEFGHPTLDSDTICGDGSPAVEKISGTYTCIGVHQAGAAPDLRDCDFTGWDLTGVDFSGANLTDAVFVDAQIGSADFTGADLTNATFSNAIGFADPKEDLGNGYLENGPLVAADFSGATCPDGDPVGPWQFGDFTTCAPQLLGGDTLNLDDSNLWSTTSFEGADFAHLMFEMSRSLVKGTWTDAVLYQPTIQDSEFNADSDFVRATIHDGSLKDSTVRGNWEMALFDNVEFTNTHIDYGTQMCGADFIDSTFHNSCLEGNFLRAVHIGNGLNKDEFKEDWNLWGNKITCPDNSETGTVNESNHDNNGGFGIYGCSDNRTPGRDWDPATDTCDPSENADTSGNFYHACDWVRQ